VSTRTKQIIWLVLLVLVVNLPLLHSTLNRWQVQRSGTEVTATVVDSAVLGDDDEPAYWIGYRLPQAVDPGRTVWSRELEKSAYDDAVASGRVTVRVLDDERATAQVEGQVVSRAGLVATLVADLLILGFLWVLRRYGRYGRPKVLRLEAVEDVTPGEGEQAVQDVDDLVVVSGTVAEVTEHDVVIETEGQRVVVVLDGHAVLVDEGRMGRVRGRRLG
jgi:hypothetical protein